MGEMGPFNRFGVSEILLLMLSCLLMWALDDGAQWFDGIPLAGFVVSAANYTVGAAKAPFLKDQ